MDFVFHINNYAIDASINSLKISIDLILHIQIKLLLNCYAVHIHRQRNFKVQRNIILRFLYIVLMERRTSCYLSALLFGVFGTGKNNPGFSKISQEYREVSRGVFLSKLVRLNSELNLADTNDLITRRIIKDPHGNTWRPLKIPLSLSFEHF